MMGGRAAEKVVYGELWTGAQNDLPQATALARRMVEEFGMSAKVGPLALSRPGLFLPVDGGRPEPVSPELAAEADAEVKRLVETAEKRAEDLLGEWRDHLDELASLLLERETLEGAELRDAIARVGAEGAAEKLATRGDGVRATRASPARGGSPR